MKILILLTQEALINTWMVQRSACFLLEAGRRKFIRAHWRVKLKVWSCNNQKAQSNLSSLSCHAHFSLLPTSFPVWYIHFVNPPLSGSTRCDRYGIGGRVEVYPPLLYYPQEPPNHTDNVSMVSRLRRYKSTMFNILPSVLWPGMRLLLCRMAIRWAVR